MDQQKNIIFDLHGVLFEHNVPGQEKLFSAIEPGIVLLEDCYTAAQQKGYKLFACTNWQMTYVDILEQDFPHIFKMFDGAVTPTVSQAKKPDPRMFQYLLDTYNLIPHLSVFIDDQIANVEAARTLGLQGIHLDDYATVQSELKRFGF